MPKRVSGQVSHFVAELQAMANQATNDVAERDELIGVIHRLAADEELRDRVANVSPRLGHLLDRILEGGRYES